MVGIFCIYINFDYDSTKNSNDTGLKSIDLRGIKQFIAAKSYSFYAIFKLV